MKTFTRGFIEKLRPGKCRMIIFMLILAFALTVTGCGKKKDKQTTAGGTVVTTEKTTEKTTEATTAATEATTVEETEAATEATTEAPTEAPTEAKKEKKKEETTKAEKKEKKTEAPTEVATEESKATKAQAYVGRTLDDLAAAFGAYTLQEGGACSLEGELSAIATFDGFTAYLHSENGQTVWIVDAVR